MKVRYREIGKNLAQMQALFRLANLFRVRRQPMVMGVVHP